MCRAEAASGPGGGKKCPNLPNYDPLVPIAKQPDVARIKDLALGIGQPIARRGQRYSLNRDLADLSKENSLP